MYDILRKRIGYLSLNNEKGKGVSLIDNRETVTQRKLATTQPQVIQLGGSGINKTISKKKSTLKKQRKNVKYGIGQHGAKAREQKRLKKEFKKSVSGKTHQSEHVFRFSALNMTSPQTRKESGVLERKAAAYQERYSAHRSHVGTGSSKKIDNTGFSSVTYSKAQRDFMEVGDLSTAGQLNTLGYGFQSDFSNKSTTTEGKQASDSYKEMIKNTDEVSYMNGTHEVNVKQTYMDKLEQLTARIAIEKGHTWPTKNDVNEAGKILSKKHPSPY